MTRWILLTLWILGALAAWGQSVPIAADNSLSEAVYSQKYSMPPTGRVWKTSDYGRAVDALQDVLAASPMLLPRRASGASGHLFRKIMSTDDLKQLPNESLRDYATRMNSRLTACNQVLMLYLQASQKTGQMFDSELLDSMVTVLHVSTVLNRSVTRAVQAAEGAQARGNPDVQHGQEMVRQGRAMMAHGMATTMNGFLITLTEKNHYRLSELRGFAHDLQSD